MNPQRLFEQLWARGDELALLYDNLVNMGIPQSRADELLRAEWVARLAALDLYVHELVASRMLDQFEGRRPIVPGFAKFKIGAETLWRIAAAVSANEKASAFDLEIRAQMSHLTFQMPDKIADAVRFTSEVKLWEEVAKLQNPTLSAAEIKTAQRALKTTLSSMVERRNKIAHEGDLGPGIPREPWPIDLEQIETVRQFVSGLIDSIGSVLRAADERPVVANADADDQQDQAELEEDDVADGLGGDPPAGAEI